MGGKAKQQKFDAIREMHHVFQIERYDRPVLQDHTGKDIELKGKWHELAFGNDKPITLELACGKGEYSTGMGQSYPERNFIGVDIKGNRIFYGARRSKEMGLDNVKFLRTKIDLMPRFFAANEVDEIWIIFPDPFPKSGSVNRRLTSPPYLDIYRGFLKPGGTVNLKTDADSLYEYTCEILKEQQLEVLVNDSDIYKEGEADPPLNIKTYYEGLHLEDKKTIKYLKFVP